jgi:hypothetical protein
MVKSTMLTASLAVNTDRTGARLGPVHAHLITDSIAGVHIRRGRA